MENIIKPEFGLSFWTILVFIILVIILTKYVWKPILVAINQREQKIKSDLENAEKARKEAEEIKLSIENRFKELDKEISERINAAVSDATAEKEKIIRNAQAQANLIIETAKRDIENYKKDIESDIEKKLVETSSLIASKVLSEIVDKKLDDKILELSLKEYKLYASRKN
ncbi:MAG: F0F1 ATP synthase subunit B [Elusimicrobiales bacterium]|jgi:F-type H+-transporting ATPase subunit b|nr:F0F1 ATP synthase subunit B [Elusimicrobiales bacterium]